MKAKHFILKFKVIAWSLIVFFLIGLIQVMKYNSNTVEWTGEAKFKKWDTSGQILHVVLDCNGKEVSTSNPKIITNYIKDPHPFQVKLNKSGNIITD